MHSMTYHCLNPRVLVLLALEFLFLLSSPFLLLSTGTGSGNGIWVGLVLGRPIQKLWVSECSLQISAVGSLSWCATHAVTKFVLYNESISCDRFQAVRWSLLNYCELRVLTAVLTQRNRVDLIATFFAQTPRSLPSKKVRENLESERYAIGTWWGTLRAWTKGFDLEPLTGPVSGRDYSIEALLITK